MGQPQFRVALSVIAMFGLLAFLSSGCSSKAGGQNVVVSGKVAYKGKAVTGGRIVFHQKVGESFPGEIGASGEFLLGGLPVGEMVVTIENDHLKNAKDPNEAAANLGLDEKQMAALMKDKNNQKLPVSQAVYVPIPSKYADKSKSGLSCTLTAGKQEKSFDLTD